jgi:hypothetical protein
MVRFKELLGNPKCHPKFRRTNRNTCIPDSELVKVVRDTNIIVGSSRNVHNSRKSNKGSKTRSKRLRAVTASQKNKTSRLRKQLAVKIGCQSNSERCLVEKLPINAVSRRNLESFLRPKMPDSWKNDPDQWLDNTNIEAVMKQYEEARNDFKFLGVHPIDFSAPNPYESSNQLKCMVPQMCNVSVPQLRKSGIKSVGVVFNLDPHTKSGSHWVSCFIDIDKCWVYYFDSYGIKPPRLIHLFMKSLLRDEPRMKLGYNSRRFQFGGSECGMYSLYFLVCMLEGAKFKEFVHRPVPDDVMLQLRKWFFSD